VLVAPEGSDAVKAAPPPERVGSYVLVRRIGSGGMAEVWLGRHVVSGGVAAVKRLSARGGSSSHSTFSRGRGELLAREAQTIAGLSHPHIVPLFEFGDGFVVMPYIEGMSLARRMQTPLEPAIAVRIGRQIAAALEHAHERGIVHRDVKPSNILLDQNETAYLSDFGIAISADEEGRTAGTPRYMAPEQRRGDRVGPAADQYGLARTLLEVLCGGNMPERRDEALAQLPASLEALRPVLERGTAQEVTARFPSMAAFEAALAAIDLAGASATVRKAEPRRAPDPYPWSATPRVSENLGPDLVRGDYRLRELASCGRLEPERVARFLDGAGLADLGFSIYASSPRLGELSDPDLLARVAEVIVLVHGSTSSRNVWRLLAPSLCRDNALSLVLVPDLHGYGETPFAAAKPSREHLALRSNAQNVLGLCRLLGLVDLPTVLVGHSMGAMSLLTLDDSDVDAQVARVLINPMYIEHDARLRRGMLSMAKLARAVGRFPWLRRKLTRYFCTTGPAEQLTREDQEEMIHLSLAVTPGVVAGVCEALGSVEFKRGRQRRVALLCGVDDPWTRDQALLDRATSDIGIDPAHIHLLASGGHTPQTPLSTHPEWTARNVDEIGRIVQAMILTAHEPTSTPSMTATSVGTGTTW
jgi:serine/threonine protein kinase